LPPPRAPAAPAEPAGPLAQWFGPEVLSPTAVLPPTRTELPHRVPRAREGIAGDERAGLAAEMPASDDFTPLARAGEPGGLAHAAKPAQKLRIWVARHGQVHPVAVEDHQQQDLRLRAHHAYHVELLAERHHHVLEAVHRKLARQLREHVWRCRPPRLPPWAG